MAENLLTSCFSFFSSRVFSAYINEVEDKPPETAWGTKVSFQNLMAEFFNGGGKWFFMH